MPEERYDAVTPVLVHRPLGTVHTVGENSEKSDHDAVPRFGVEQRLHVSAPTSVAPHSPQNVASSGFSCLQEGQNIAGPPMRPQ